MIRAPAELLLPRAAPAEFVVTIVVYSHTSYLY